MNWALAIMWAMVVILGVFTFSLSREIGKIFNMFAAIWRDLDRLATRITYLELDNATNNKTNKVKEKK